MPREVRAGSRLTNGQLQVGCIGVGNHGATNLAAIARHARVVAVCDVDERYLAAATERYSDAKTFRDFRELLEHPGLDAVVVSTPDHTHAIAVLGAMKRGLHVFCEKPLTRTVDELQCVLATATKHKVVTQTGMQHHTRAGTRLAAAILRTELLGEVERIYAWTDRPIWPQGMDRAAEREAEPRNFDWNLWLGPAKERPYSSAYHPLRWRGWCDFGTGTLGDFGPHLLDAVFWGLDLPAPEKVQARAASPVTVAYPSQSEIEFTFPEARNHKAIALTWLDGGKQPAKEILGVERVPPNGVLVVGSHAKLFIPDYGRTPRLIDAKSSVVLPAPLEAPDDIHANWVAACRGEQEACLPLERVAPLMQTCLLGNVALRHGKQVIWNHRKQQLSPKEATKFLSDEPRAGWEL